MGKKVGFVILNYCTWEETLRCAKKIRENKQQYEYVICVVDNNSPEKAPGTLLSELKTVADTVIMNRDNKGYNAGNNIGLEYLLSIRCDYYVIVNSDVIIEYGAIEKMIDISNCDKKIGIVGPKVIEKGKESFNGCNRQFSLLDYYVSTTPIAVLFKQYGKKLHSYKMKSQDHYAEVFSVSGCCFLITKNCCERIFPLDESRKLYNEENMLGIRMAKLGFSTVVAVDAVINHLHGSSTSKDPANAYIERIRSDFYYIDSYLQKPKAFAFPLFVIRKSIFLIKSRTRKGFNPNHRKIPKFNNIYN